MIVPPSGKQEVSTPASNSRAALVAELQSIDLINKKLVEANIQRSVSPDMRRKEHMIRKNYYRQYISRQESASQKRYISVDRAIG